MGCRTHHVAVPLGPEDGEHIHAMVAYKTEYGTVIYIIPGSQQTPLTDHGLKRGQVVHIPESCIQDSDPDTSAGVTILMQYLRIHQPDLFGGNPVFKVRGGVTPGAQTCYLPVPGGNRFHLCPVPMEGYPQKF